MKRSTAKPACPACGIVAPLDRFTCEVTRCPFPPDSACNAPAASLDEARLPSSSNSSGPPA
jgi:hypothetical protein